MLITNLLPMLGNYSLAFDLVAGDDGVVTLIIIPRVAEGKTHKAEAASCVRSRSQRRPPRSMQSLRRAPRGRSVG